MRLTWALPVTELMMSTPAIVRDLATVAKIEVKKIFR